MKRFSLYLFFSLFSITLFSQQYLYEGFETGSKPEGWTEEYASGSEPWRFRNGGHSPNDNNWAVPPEQEDITRNPDGAFEGTFNAIFFKQGNNNERTKLITPPIDMLGSVNAQLSFYLCQRTWTFEGSVGWDIMRVYYKTSEEGTWNLLHEYLDPIYDWERQTLSLPEPNETYYIAFEGQTRWGYGTCIDSIEVKEIGSQQMFISQVDTRQPFDEFIPSDNQEVPMMRVDVRVLGNTGSVAVDEITFTSLNTSDGDISPSGAKLFYTETQDFSTDMQLGTASNFVSGEVTFSGLNHTVPRGVSYLWLTYDIDPAAGHENVLDVMLKANNVSGGGSTFPDVDQSPEGRRVIYSTIFKEDFEGSPAWDLFGEFEIAPPQGLGGTPGNPDPSEAFSGTNILGTDLTGLGPNPYKYEPGVSEGASYLATSPVNDALYYKNLNIFYQRYMNIEFGDQAKIQVSNDNGLNWYTVWDFNSYLSDFQFIQEQIQIPDTYSRAAEFQVRFKLGPTDNFDNHSGWNIDDLYLTGEFITKDVGISEWIEPVSGSGHTSSEPVTVRVTNFGGAAITDPVPVAFSLDNGDTWTINNMNTDIPIGGSVLYTFTSTADLSEPGLYDNVLAKTFLPGDQYIGNDQISTSFYVIPTYVAPYSENFEINDGYWRSTGKSLWDWGTPSGSLINNAASGSYSWITGDNVSYGDRVSQESQTFFEDDFESADGWIFTEEFERATPSNMFIPLFANSGFYCIGTDLTGTGAAAYLYENNISEGNGNINTATSPAIDVSQYSEIEVSFARWLEIQQGDSVKFEVSNDNGSTWNLLWKNTEGAISDGGFVFYTYNVPEELTNSTQMRFRFSLYYTSSGGAVSAGWNIDDFSLTGDLVDVSSAYLTSPSYDFTGLSQLIFDANIWVETEDGVDGARLEYSVDDGNTWSPMLKSTAYDSYWNWYTGNNVSALGSDGWTGSTNEWVSTRQLLTSILHGASEAMFRIHFTYNKSNNEFDGIAFDDIRIFQAPDDLGVVSIVSPVSDCYLSDRQQFEVQLRNYGVTNLFPGDSVRIGYEIDYEGMPVAQEEWFVMVSTLIPGATTTVLLKSEFDMSASGSYDVSIFTIEDDPYFYYATSNDSASTVIEVNKPYVELGPDISTTQPDTVILNAFSGQIGNDYLWQDGSQDSVYNVFSEGTYSVEVTNGFGCVAKDTVHVLELVLDVGVQSIVSPQSACELGSAVNIEIVVENFGTDTLAVQDTIILYCEVEQTLEFQDTIILASRFIPGQTFSHVFSAYDFSLPNNYEISAYTGYSKDGVPGNDAIDVQIDVFGYPDIDLGPDTVVQTVEYLLDPGQGYQTYLWQDGSSLDQLLVTLEGTYHVMVSDINNCTSYDTVEVGFQIADLELTEILSPASSCELVTSVTVSGRVTNRGNSAISSGTDISLAYTVDGGPEVLESFPLSQDLSPGGSVDLTFSSSENVSSGNNYSFTVYVSYGDDVFNGNDTLNTTIGVYEPAEVDLGDPEQVIAGFDYTLDAGPGFSSYLWQDGSTGQTYTITEPGIGIYSVTVTNSNGCEAYDEVQVLLAVPDIGIQSIISPATSCTLSGDEPLSINIKNFGSYSIPSSEVIQVSYSVNGSDAIIETVPLEEDLGGGAVLPFTFSTTIDMSEAGSYQFVISSIYAADLIPTNDIHFKTIDVFGAPVVNISNGQDTMYIDNAITLSVDPGYASYLWQDGNTTNNYSISSPGYGLYRVDVTAENGCVTSDSIFIVYDVPDLWIKDVVSPVSGCGIGEVQPVSLKLVNEGFFLISPSEEFTLTYSINGQSSVLQKFHMPENLMPGDSVILTFDQGFDFTEPGTYSIGAGLIWLEDSDGTNNFLSVNVTGYGSPVVDIGGGEDTLTVTFPYVMDAGSGFTSYLWQDEATTTQTFQADEAGQYWVFVTNEYDCVGSDTVTLMEPSSTSAYTGWEDKINIYPNPAREFVNVIMKMKDVQQVRLEIFSIDNKLLYIEDIDHRSYSHLKLDINDLVRGTYYLRIRSAGGEMTKLIIKY